MKISDNISDRGCRAVKTARRLLPVMLAVLLPTLAAAQQVELAPPAAERGFALGARIVTSFIEAEDSNPGASPHQFYLDNVGPGLELLLDYACTSNFALRMSLAAAGHESTLPGISVAYSTVVFEAHYRFRPGAAARPYVFGGLGGAAIVHDNDAYDLQVSGAVGVLGLGTLIHLSDHLLVDLAARLDMINWSEIQLALEQADGTRVELTDPVEESGGAGKLLVGLVWDF